MEIDGQTIGLKTKELEAPRPKSIQLIRCRAPKQILSDLEEETEEEESVEKEEEKQQRPPTLTINLMTEEESGEENKENSNGQVQSLMSTDSSFLGMSMIRTEKNLSKGRK